MLQLAKYLELILLNAWILMYNFVLIIQNNVNSVSLIKSFDSYPGAGHDHLMLSLARGKRQVVSMQDNGKYDVLKEFSASDTPAISRNADGNYFLGLLKSSSDKVVPSIRLNYRPFSNFRCTL